MVKYMGSLSFGEINSRSNPVCWVPLSYVPIGTLDQIRKLSNNFFGRCVKRIILSIRYHGTK